MDVKEWFRAAVIGLVVGSAATAFVGFTYGGWTTVAKADQIAIEKTKLGVADALAPYCLERAKADPTYATKLAALKAGNSYNQTAIIQDSGWATLPGSTKPDTNLAASCQVLMAASL
jgi:hypothetical protein